MGKEVARKAFMAWDPRKGDGRVVGVEGQDRKQDRIFEWRFHINTDFIADVHEARYLMILEPCTLMDCKGCTRLLKY